MCHGEGFQQGTADAFGTECRLLGLALRMKGSKQLFTPRRGELKLLSADGRSHQPR